MRSHWESKESLVLNELGAYLPVFAVLLLRTTEPLSNGEALAMFTTFTRGDRIQLPGYWRTVCKTGPRCDSRPDRQ